MIYLLALLLGITAGLRAVTPLAALSWGAYFGWINLSGTWASFLGNIIVAIVVTLLAIAELVSDQLPTTPSRKVPQQFVARLVLGAAVGLVLGLPSGAWIGGIVAGVIGAVIGTYGGAEVRARLAKAFGRDLPAGLIEDAVAIVVALLVVHAAG
jgi:uncharacterized membrane protein